MTQTPPVHYLTALFRNVIPAQELTVLQVAIPVEFHWHQLAPARKKYRASPPPPAMPTPVVYQSKLDTQAISPVRNQIRMTLLANPNLHPASHQTIPNEIPRRVQCTRTNTRACRWMDLRIEWF